MISSGLSILPSGFHEDEDADLADELLAGFEQGAPCLGKGWAGESIVDARLAIRYRCCALAATM